MHGLIANQLRSYAVARQGREAWIEAVRKAGGALPESSPRLNRTYPDEAVAAVPTRTPPVRTFKFMPDVGEYRLCSLLAPPAGFGLFDIRVWTVGVRGSADLRTDRRGP